MKRLARWTMRLYPARWRRRYGDELDALIEQTGADARIIANLFAGGIRMQFSEWSFAKLAAVMGMAGLVIGVAASYMVAPMYRSSAELQVSSTDAASERELIGRSAGLVLSRSGLSSVINDPRLNLYMDDLKVEPLEDVIERMKGNIGISIVRPHVVELSFLYSDPLKARNSVDALAVGFQEAAAELQLKARDSGRAEIDVIDTPSLAVRPVFPSMGLVAFIGFAAGLGAAFVWRRWRGKRLATWGFAGMAALLGFIGFIGSQAAFIYLVMGDRSGENPLGVNMRSTETISVRKLAPAQVEALRREVLSTPSLLAAIEDRRLNLYSWRENSGQLEKLAQKMRDHLNLEYDPVGHYMTVTFFYPNRYLAQQTVWLLSDRIESTSRSLGEGAASALSGTVSALRRASNPVLPVSPNRMTMAGIGGAAGLSMAAFAAVIRRRWKPEPELPAGPVSD